MREIKFRAWSRLTHTMSPGCTFVQWIEQYQVLQEMQPAEHFNPEKAILMQFTGLKDKNGKEIYEGDVFNCLYHRDGHTDHQYVVTYRTSDTAFVLTRMGEPCPQVQVVQHVRDHAGWYAIAGNIYENPELLTA